MKPYVWKEGMTDREEADGAYWERNVLALLLASTWNQLEKAIGFKSSCGWYEDRDNNWEGWKRVISIGEGSITFHVPDAFDMGDLPQIEPNWDKHNTYTKWTNIMKICGCDMNDIE